MLIKAILVFTLEGERTVYRLRGVWRLKGVGRNSEQGICHMCGKGEDGSHILGCKGIKIWRDHFGQEVRNIAVEIGIMRIVGYRNKEHS
jgi:hypothetical protein